MLLYFHSRIDTQEIKQSHSLQVMPRTRNDFFTGDILRINALPNCRDYGENRWMHPNPSWVCCYIQSIGFGWIKTREEMIYVPQEGAIWQVDAHCCHYTWIPGIRSKYLTLVSVSLDSLDSR